MAAVLTYVFICFFKTQTLFVDDLSKWINFMNGINDDVAIRVSISFSVAEITY